MNDKLGAYTLSVTLVIDHLGLGGAERILSIMANHWARKGWHITFMTLDHGNGPHFYPLDPRVRYMDFGWGAVRKKGIPKMRLLTTWLYLRSSLKKTKADIIISFLNTTNVSVLASCYKLGVPVIVSERNDPHHDVISPLWEWLRNVFYPTAAKVVVQTRQALAYFQRNIQQRSTIIPNPVLLPSDYKKSERKQGTGRTGYEIIAVGRLAPQKGFDLLIKAFSLIAHEHPDWRLTIWGEGAERGMLEFMVKDLGMEKSVHLPGKTKDIFQEYRQADIFILSSRYEGFPNSLCEAMACGLPAISFDCRSGPSEIIRNGYDGLLVDPENVEALAVSMKKLMNDPALRSTLSSHAVEITERYNFDRIMSDWEHLIRNSLIR